MVLYVIYKYQYIYIDITQDRFRLTVVTINNKIKNLFNMYIYKIFIVIFFLSPRHCCPELSQAVRVSSQPNLQVMFVIVRW